MNRSYKELLSKMNPQTDVYKILKYIVENGGASYPNEMRKAIGKEVKNKKHVVTYCAKLVTRGVLVKSKFQVYPRKGHVYGISYSHILQKAISHGLIPKGSFLMLDYIVKNKFCISSQLREFGISGGEVIWINKHLAGQYIKKYDIENNLYAYFSILTSDQEIAKIKQSPEFQNTVEKFRDIFRGNTEFGATLEEIAIELYTSLGYQIEHHKCIPNSVTGTVMFFDLVCKKSRDPAGLMDEDLVVVECKRRRGLSNEITVADLLKLDCQAQVAYHGKARIHILTTGGIANSVFQYLRYKPYIHLFDFYELRKICNAYKIKKWQLIEDFYAKQKVKDYSETALEKVAKAIAREMGDVHASV